MFRSHPVSDNKCFIRETPIHTEPTRHSANPSCAHLSVSLKELDGSYWVGVELTQAHFFSAPDPLLSRDSEYSSLRRRSGVGLVLPFHFSNKGKTLACRRLCFCNLGGFYYAIKKCREENREATYPIKRSGIISVYNNNESGSGSCSVSASQPGKTGIDKEKLNAKDI